MLELRERMIAAPPASSADRRSARRNRVLKGATLTFNKGYGAFEGVVRDLNDAGARLSFGDASAVPSSFILRIGDDARARLASVRWRSASMVGVAFG